MVAWDESKAYLQPPTSVEETVLVRGCKLVEAQIDTSTRSQLALVQIRRVGCYLGRLVGGCWPSYVRG